MSQNVTNQSRSRKADKNEPSQELLEFIDTVNSIPLQFKFENVLDSMTFSAVTSGQEIQEPSSKTSILETIYNGWRSMRKSVKQYPLLRNYLKKKVGVVEHYNFGSKKQRITSEYSTALLNFEELREEFIEIVYGLNNEPEMLPYINFAQSTVRFTIVEGKISFRLTEIISLLDGLEADRLRICKICNNIFWAFRKDAQGCSVQCNQTHRTRKWREKNERRFSRENRKNGTL